MTAETTTVSLDAIDAALAAATPCLSEDEQRLAAALLRLLPAASRSPSPPRPPQVGCPGRTNPVTGEAITFRIGEDGAITGASHPDSALSFLRPGQPWGDDVMTTFCHYVPHFTGPATAQRWTAAHPGTS